MEQRDAHAQRETSNYSTKLEEQVFITEHTTKIGESADHLGKALKYEHWSEGKGLGELTLERLLTLSGLRKG